MLELRGLECHRIPGSQGDDGWMLQCSWDIGAYQMWHVTLSSPLEFF